MARPMKQGIDYYPLSVEFLKDIKIRKIKRACGPQTVEILLCLLGNIYRENGYYIGWDEDTAFLVADEVGAKEGLVEEIVNKATQVGFFNREKFEQYKILTSKGIQERFTEATRKRKDSVISDIYSVIDALKSEETIVNSVNNEQSKVNKSKLNKIKQNNKHQEKPKEDDEIYPGEFIQSLYRQFPSPLLSQAIAEWVQKWDKSMINYAIEVAHEYSVELKGLKPYINRILEKWTEKNITTVDQAKAANKERREQNAKPRYQKAPAKQEVVPKWLIDQQNEEKAPKSVEQVESIKSEVSEDELEARLQSYLRHKEEQKIHER